MERSIPLFIIPFNASSVVPSWFQESQCLRKQAKQRLRWHGRAIGYGYHPVVWGVGKGSQVEGRWWARNTQPHVTNNLCRSSHSISELGCSSGVKCAVFRQDTPSKELRFLKREHNSFHGGTRTTFLEILVEVPDIMTAWKAHVLCNLKDDSFPHTGETCYEAHHCHPEASLLRRAE